MPTDESLLTGMTKDQLDALVQAMVTAHCAWLNLHCAANGEEHRYSTTDFSPITNEYAIRRVLATTLVGSSCLVIHVEIHDGDEGGPTILTGFHDEETVAWYQHKRNGQMVISGWEGDAASWAYSHTEHLGWRLNDQVIEFDTERSQTLRNGEPINCPDSSELSNGDIGWGE